MKLKTIVAGGMCLLVVGMGVSADESRGKRFRPGVLGIKVLEWSEYKTDEKTGLKCRLGILGKTVSDDPGEMLSFLLELTNAGESSHNLRGSSGKDLVCMLLIDGKSESMFPMPGILIEEPILLKPGESWIQTVCFPNQSTKIEAGEHELSVSIGRMGEDGAWVELRTPAVSIEFVRDSE